MSIRPVTPDVSLAAKVAFLSGRAAHAGCADQVEVIETHMSWVFLAGERVVKLKKPVCLPHLDFATLSRRRAACEAEYVLNRVLAPDVYLGVAPLVLGSGGLAVGGEGPAVDWVVLMRRLASDGSLETRILAGEISIPEIDGVARLMSAFYRRARRAWRSPALQLADYRRAVEENAKILLRPELQLPSGPVRYILAAQRRFLTRHADLLEDRVRSGRLVDAHGDLRPEHIWPGVPPRVIDRLEFNARLRTQDPLEELAFLDMELERIGALDVAERLVGGVVRALGERPRAQLYGFYRCYKATLRARLAIAHLLEPEPRFAEEWPRQARAYLSMAVADARALAVGADKARSVWFTQMGRRRVSGLPSRISTSETRWRELERLRGERQIVELVPTQAGATMETGGSEGGSARNISADCRAAPQNTRS